MTDQPQLPPVKLAFILDGVVQDVLHTDDRLAAIFMSEPIILDISDKFKEIAEETKNPSPILVGWEYDGTTVVPPKE